MGGPEPANEPSTASIYSTDLTPDASSMPAPDESDQAPSLNSRNSSLQALQKRLSILEQRTVPSLERALESNRANITSKEFQASLVALQHVADALAQQIAQCSAASALRSLGWQVWLGTVAVAGHAQQLLSGADVAALLLSRRLLLQRDPFEGPHEDPKWVGRRSLLGGAFFLAAVEATWQAQSWLGPKLPKRAQHASEGIAKAVRVLRIACWASAFILTTSAARQACFAAADGVQGWTISQTQPLLPSSHPAVTEATQAVADSSEISSHATPADQAPGDREQPPL